MLWEMIRSNCTVVYFVDRRDSEGPNTRLASQRITILGGPVDFAVELKSAPADLLDTVCKRNGRMPNVHVSLFSRSLEKCYSTIARFMNEQ
jgi:hypothetical protein